MPISMTANADERMFRWPTVSVSQPRAQTVPTTRASTVIIG